MPNRPRTYADWVRRALIAIMLTIGAAFLPNPVSATDAELPADLAQAWADYDRATVSKDIARLAELVTDDYLLVNSDASIQGKASYLADFRVPDFKLDPYQIEQPLRKILGNFALTGGVFNLGWTQDGRHQHRRLRFVHVWSRQDGRWRISYTQLTHIPE